MSNPFKKILPNHKVSPAVKQQILLDIQMIKQTIEISDLFVLKFPDTISNLSTE